MDRCPVKLSRIIDLEKHSAVSLNTIIPINTQLHILIISSYLAFHFIYPKIVFDVIILNNPHKMKPILLNYSCINYITIGYTWININFTNIVFKKFEYI